MSEIDWEKYWEELKSKLSPYRKIAWEPQTQEQVTEISDSKFCGMPLLTAEGWPECGNCNEPMQLFVQLNSKDLPEASNTPFGDGILQVFYCVNENSSCEADCDTWAANSKATLLRILPLNIPAQTEVTLTPSSDYPELKITGWEELEDYPDTFELEELGVELSEDEEDFLCEDEVPFSGEKLLGWPHWVQGIEYQSCKICNKQMQFIFQIDSSGNIPYMFGDSGCAHISQCTEHKEQLAMAWACC
ncbi:DUF1963 domain-containing protein [Microbulbifer sp. TRSA007]|uniref:DUF1963 domain-containing protein n=1 Tax=Microbulbifer sp. TRSA007 TaxID=3243384 RepID=UPI00403A68A9